MSGFVLTCVAIGIASLALTYLARSILLRRAILDLPNARSSHTVPTPRGGGWGLMLALLPAWIWSTARAGRLNDPAEILLILGAVALMAVSWIDDRRGLGPAPRFAAQAVAVGLVMAALPRDLSLTAGLLPLPLDRLAAGLAWLWFVNLFNFMDGIDGIAGGSAAAMGIGIMLVSMLHGPHELQAFRGAAIAAASVGFLVWNWQPAKIFLGDVGSVPLGYLLGFELMQLAMDAGQVAALIIALYYLADATITLLRRAGRRERIWQAHREHFYQRAVRGGRSHAQVAAAALLIQLLLALLALESADSGGWSMIFPAVILVALLLLWMARPSKGAA
ncbi:MAG TPA: glycosyltransferase family 4 protein [Alphaproteobacteria bacterium]|nr:glycosyltransferase family 4 protein [Alphaproteobacteria bacterium]